MNAQRPQTRHPKISAKRFCQNFSQCHKCALCNQLPSIELPNSKTADRHPVLLCCCYHRDRCFASSLPSDRTPSISFFYRHASHAFSLLLTANSHAFHLITIFPFNLPCRNTPTFRVMFMSTILEHRYYLTAFDHCTVLHILSLAFSVAQFCHDLSTGGQHHHLIPLEQLLQGYAPYAANSHLTKAYHVEM